MPTGIKRTVDRRDLLKGSAGLSLVAATPGYARAQPPSRLSSVQKLINDVIAEPAAPGAIAAVGRAAFPQERGRKSNPQIDIVGIERHSLLE